MNHALSEDAVVGVVGEPGAVVDAVVDVLEAAGRSPVVDSARGVIGQDPAFVIAVGDAALFSLVAADVAVPVLPVDAGPEVGGGVGVGVASVPGGRTAVQSALNRLVAGDWTTVDRPVVAADPLGARALADLVVVTAEPAQISEYAVCTGAETIARFRADGLVVATAVGSPGYARAAGGPVLAPDSESVVVVPVGAFVTDPEEWVLPVDALEVTVQRDEMPVELHADDRTVGTVDPGTSLTFRRDGRITLAVVEESRSGFVSEQPDR